MIQLGSEVIRYEGVEYMRKFNPYHDPHNGQFTTAEGAGQADDDDDSNADVDSEDDSDTDDSAVGSDVANAIVDGMNGTSRLDSGTRVAGDDSVPSANVSDQALGEKSKNECIEECTEKTLPTNDFGASFFRCLNECLGQ